MNRGERHARLYEEYICDRVEAEQERYERELQEAEDRMVRMEDDLFYDGWDDEPDDWRDVDEYEDAQAFSDWLDSLDDWFDQDEIDPRPETAEERYERIWREVGY